LKNKKDKNVRLLIIAGILLLTGGCDIFSNGSGANNQISVNNNLAKLNQRIHVVNKPVTLDSGKTKSPNPSLVSGKNRFTHIVDIDAPAIGADQKKLSATGVQIQANKIYVSYQLHGSEYGGAVDMIDMKDLKGNSTDNPSIVSSIDFSDTDINALDIEQNGKLLWITGGRDVHKSNYNTENHYGAIVGEISIVQDGFLSKNYRETPLPSYSGNAIVDTGNQLYAAAGATDGGFFELDKSTLEISNSFYTDYAKSVDRRKDDIIGLYLSSDKQMAEFRMMNFNGKDSQSYDTRLAVNPSNGKNVIEHFGDITYAALGDQGVKGYKFDGSTKPLVYSFKAEATDAANGVTVDGEYVYVANGIDGLYITSRNCNNKKEPVSVYHWNSGPGSANNVKTDGNYIIVAKGVDGISILRKNY